MSKNTLKLTILLALIHFVPALANIDRGKEAYFMGDYERAHKEFIVDAGAGNTYAQIKLGFMYENGWGAARDYGTARNWYQKAAEAGDPEGHIALGKLFAYAKGVSKDASTSKMHLLKAAELGHPHGYYVLADSHNDDFAFGHHEEIALKYYLLAAEQNAAAYSRNGHYSKGSGQWFRLITSEGVRLTRIAADGGNVIAQFNTGLRYYFGEGVARDHKQAEKYFMMAASAGNVEAQSFVGQNRAMQNPDYDMILVDTWFTIAASGGDKVASANKSKLERNMTAEQIAEAEKAANQWLAQR